MFIIRIERAADGSRETLDGARYCVTGENQRHEATIQVFNYGSDVPSATRVLTSGDRAFVMNGRGDTVDAVRTVARGPEAVSA